MGIGVAYRSWNYLRVRGEYAKVEDCHATTLELPPRARRIQIKHIDFRKMRGTTSACAENTPTYQG